MSGVVFFAEAQKELNEAVARCKRRPNYWRMRINL